MARTLITDDIWQQIQDTMRLHGCYRSKNSRNIMEAILWKLRTGATWRDIPQELCPWQTAYNRFNRWASKGLWDKFFLDYEASWIRNGYSLMEATYACINMQVSSAWFRKSNWTITRWTNNKNTSCNRREWITD